MHDRILALIILNIGVALVILFAHVKPQPGFIVTTKGDTVACILKNAGQYSIDYKVNKDSSYHNAGVETIKEYQITKNKEVYRSLVMPGKITPVFMQLRDTGQINLYVFYEHIGKAVYHHLYAVKGKDQLVKIYGYNNDTDNKTNLEKLIAGNQQAQDYLKGQKKYTDKAVVNTIRIYNGGNADGNKK